VITANGGAHGHTGGGTGGLDPVSNGGTIGVNGGPRPPSGGGIGHNGGGGHGHGHGNNGGGGIGHNSGWGTVNNNTHTFYNGGGCGHVASGGICGSCTGNNVWVNTGWTQQTCNSYYSYGFYDYYGYFGGNVNNGFCYTGIWGGINFTLVYPWLDPGCQVVNIVPRRNRRVVILQSDCGTFWWRVVERRTWVPGYYAWINGCNRWVDGYWSWRVVNRRQIWDYDYCMECYY
jgi:hypothetical protein